MNNRARDAALRRVRETFLRTHPPPEIWAIPPPPITFIDVDNEPSLVVARIDRPATAPLRWWKIGGPPNQRMTGDDAFTAVSPLEITFTAASFGKHGCTNPRLWVADTWELQRILWVHPRIAIPSNASIARGMSKMNVAHVLGFPAKFGTAAEMLRLDSWELPPVLMPFYATVHFRNGRVSSYEPPGEPP